jgi:hypothetical protein
MSYALFFIFSQTNAFQVDGKLKIHWKTYNFLDVIDLTFFFFAIALWNEDNLMYLMPIKAENGVFILYHFYIELKMCIS